MLDGMIYLLYLQLVWKTGFLSMYMLMSLLSKGDFTMPNSKFLDNSCISVVAEADEFQQIWDHCSPDINHSAF